MAVSVNTTLHLMFGRQNTTDNNDKVSVMFSSKTIFIFMSSKLSQINRDLPPLLSGKVQKILTLHGYKYYKTRLECNTGCLCMVEFYM